MSMLLCKSFPRTFPAYPSVQMGTRIDNMSELVRTEEVPHLRVPPALASRGPLHAYPSSPLHCHTCNPSEVSE
eukprot:2957192-Pyramimonas_sp.AAC.1